jgi:ABC-type phosphate/phosphonate transport system substrate-binding protein
MPDLQKLIVITVMIIVMMKELKVSLIAENNIQSRIETFDILIDDIEKKLQIRIKSK